MKLKQALKVKNRLINDLKELGSIIPATVSELSQKEFSGNTVAMLEDYRSQMDLFCNHKVAIQKANLNILKNIYMMAELKGYLNILRTTKNHIKEGKEYSGRFGVNGVELEYKTQLTIKQVDEQIKSIRKQINDIQDEIDEYNSVTEL
jgi:hypothetical protein